MLENKELFKFMDHFILSPDLEGQEKEDFIADFIEEIHEQIDPEELLVDNEVQPERRDLTKYWINRFKIFSKLGEQYEEAHKNDTFLQTKNKQNNRNKGKNNNKKNKSHKQQKQSQGKFGFFTGLALPADEGDDNEEEMYGGEPLTSTVRALTVPQNIYMTEELWYSVTPEDLAVFTAKWAYACLKDDLKIAIDVCCGGGGNTIQLAKHFPNCIGVDNNLQHLYCTYKNAETYGIAERVSLLYMDWNDEQSLGIFTEMFRDKVSFIFSSPPWGGPGYLNEEFFDLEKGLSLVGGLKHYLQTLLDITENIILFLPRNSDLSQLSSVTRELMGEQARCRVIYIKTEGHLKGILVLWGESLING